MENLLFVSWDIGPNLYEGFITLRYYSLLFGVSFFLGYYLMKKMFEKENCPEFWLDKILMYTVIATVVGARLGHVLFYDWDYYSQNLLEIPMVWKGGLASHGAAIAIIFAIWLYSKKITKKSMFWALDKVAITVAIAACFIRIGNLMNSEIIGEKSESNSAFFFKYETKKSIASFFDVSINDIEINSINKTENIKGFNYPLAEVIVNFPYKEKEKYQKAFYGYKQGNIDLYDAHYFSLPPPKSETIKLDNQYLFLNIAIIPRVPTQLIEAGCYLLIFFLLFWGYWKKEWYKYKGLILGLFLSLLFGSRVIIEFWKEHQTLDAENSINMGQWLSIPIVIIGIVLIFWSQRKSTK